MEKYTTICVHLHAFLLLVIVYTSLASTVMAITFRCPADQASALLRLKHSFQQPLLPSWRARTDCCQTCDAASGRVAALDLGDQGLQSRGGLPRALFQLTTLRRLNLAGNDFGGATLPASGFEQLAGLTHLNLSSAGLAGQIPAGIGNLTKLVSLDLSSNNGLSGVVPEFLAELRSLAVFRLSNNGFNGLLLQGIFQLKSLMVLDLSGNSELSGDLLELPAGSSLEVLDLSETSFYGVIPYSISNLKRLKTLDISGSNGRFSGGLPASISDLKFLSYLDLSNSGFKSLQTLDLSRNGLSGTVQLSLFWRLANLSNLCLPANRLTVTVDDEEHINSSLSAPLPPIC